MMNNFSNQISTFYILFQLAGMLFLFEFINTSLQNKKIRSFNVLRKFINNILLTIKTNLTNTLLSKKVKLGPILTLNIFAVIFTSILMFTFSIRAGELNMSIATMTSLLVLNTLSLMSALRNNEIYLDCDLKMKSNLWIITLLVFLLYTGEVFFIQNKILNNLINILSLILSLKITFKWYGAEINIGSSWYKRMLGNLYIVSTFFMFASFYIQKTDLSVLGSIRIEAYIISAIFYYILKLGLIHNSINKTEVLLNSILKKYVMFTFIITSIRIVLWKF